jgi:hypothetical protein
MMILRRLAGEMKKGSGGLKVMNTEAIQATGIECGHVSNEVLPALVPEWCE